MGSDVGDAVGEGVGESDVCEGADEGEETREYGGYTGDVVGLKSWSRADEDLSMKLAEFNPGGPINSERRGE